MRGRIGAPSVIGRRAGSRAARLGVALVCALGVAFAISATPASAVVDGHIKDFEFGESGTTAGQFEATYAGFDVAVDESTGDLYVADSENARVQKFDEDGAFLLMWGFGVKDGSNEFQICAAPGPCQKGLYGNAPKQFSLPGGIAVDNSNGPNQGRVYVADVSCWCGTGRNEILKFSPNGEYLGSINGEASPGGIFQELSGSNLDVDTAGFVWVADGERMMRFSNQPSNAYVGGSEWDVYWYAYWNGGQPVPSPSFNLAVDPDRTAVYVHTWYEGNCCGFYRFVANGSNSRLSMPTGGGPVAFDTATGHFYLANQGGLAQEYDGNPVEPKPVGPALVWEGICCGTSALAVNSDTGYVYATGQFHSKIGAFKPRRVPETVTEPATEVRHTTATINGHTAPDPVEGGDVSECVFEWGTTKTYEHKDPCEPATPISGPTDVKIDLTGLLQEGTYHYRLTTKNSVDSAHGVNRTFTTHAVIGVETGEADGITPAAATLHGSFDPDGLQTDYFFEWGRNEKLSETGHVTSVQNAGSGTGTTLVSQEIEGLEDYTKYYYRLVATNSLGTSYGAKQSFRTIPPDPPVVSQSSASGITDTSSHLSAVVKPNFGETIYGFEYGETFAYGNQALGTGLLSADGEDHPIAMDIDGLKPGQTYHYRALAVNFGGITYGPDQTFTTLDVPKVISEATSGITSSGVTLNALVHPSLSPTTVHFEYGTTTAYGSSTLGAAIGGGGSPISIAMDVSGVAAATTYHFRAVATNAIGAAVGPDQTFTTTAPGTPPPGEANRPKCKRGFVRRGGKCKKRKHRAKHDRASKGDRR